MNKPEQNQSLRAHGMRQVRSGWLRGAKRRPSVPIAPEIIDATIARTRSLEGQVSALQSENQGFRRLLLEAAQLQHKITAPHQLIRGPFEIAGEIFPARYVCGDFLTAHDVGATTVLAVGDILGKGLSAGMWFAHVLGLIRVFAGSLPNPAAIASAINRHLASFQPEPPITTAFLMQLDAHTEELTYCNAGHPAALVLRKNGYAEWLQVGGPPLGAVPFAPFASGSVVLKTGDTLLACSDGIVECRNNSGEEFGTERFLAAARVAGSSSASSLLFSVLGAAQDFAANQAAADDLALMVIHRADQATTGSSSC